MQLTDIFNHHPSPFLFARYAISSYTRSKGSAAA
jgi:hypothetical protein